MTKKDYQLIAELLNDLGDDLASKIFASRLAEVYSNFNRDKFLKACGVTK